MSNDLNARNNPAYLDAMEALDMTDPMSGDRPVDLELQKHSRAWNASRAELRETAERDWKKIMPAVKANTRKVKTGG